MRHVISAIPAEARIERALLLLLAAVSFCGTSARVMGQECSPPEVVESVRSGVKVQSAQIPLTVTELTKVRERVISLEQENHVEGAELRTVHFYEVRPATYELVNGRLASITVQLDSESVWVVGVGPSKTIYKLAGFSNSVSDFNRLMQDLAIHVRGPQDALDVFDLFLRLAHPPEFFFSVVGDAMQLQSVALQDFRLRFPESKRIAAYDRWWKTMPLKLRRAIVAPKVQNRKSNFEIGYYRYSAGVLKRESILISENGAVRSEVSSIVLYKN